MFQVIKLLKRDPVSTEMLINLCYMYLDSTDLAVVRDLTMILLGYSRFLRYDELSSLPYSDVQVKHDYLILNISKSKTDQFRQGHEVLISKGNTVACPYEMSLRYIRVSDICSPEMFLFRPIFHSNGRLKLFL